MGHSWPGAPNAGLMATDLILEFFAANPRHT
jgi:hypothetical protein